MLLPTILSHLSASQLYRCCITCQSLYHTSYHAHVWHHVTVRIGYSMHHIHTQPHLLLASLHGIRNLSINSTPPFEPDDDVSSRQKTHDTTGVVSDAPVVPTIHAYSTWLITLITYIHQHRPTLIATLRTLCIHYNKKNAACEAAVALMLDACIHLTHIRCVHAYATSQSLQADGVMHTLSTIHAPVQHLHMT